LPFSLRCTDDVTADLSVKLSVIRERSAGHRSVSRDYFHERFMAAPLAEEEASTVIFNRVRARAHVRYDSA